MPSRSPPALRLASFRGATTGRTVLLALLGCLMMPRSHGATVNVTSAVPYDEQLLQAAAGCKFGQYATGSSGAVMQAHAATAVSTYMALSASVQLPLVTGVMQTIGCACESLDGFFRTSKTTLAGGEPFPEQFFVTNPDHPPRAGVPKSDLAQAHTFGIVSEGGQDLFGAVYSRFTAMICLNKTAGAGTACQHRTTVACLDNVNIFLFLAANPEASLSDLVQQPGGCFQLAMEWNTPGGNTAWTNVMPHEIPKRLVANATADVAAIDQALLDFLTPSFSVKGFITGNPLLIHISPCDPHHTFLARTQAVANLQAFQTVYAAFPPSPVDGPSDDFTWQLMQVPNASDLLAALTMRACQYLNATASKLHLCPLAPEQLQALVAASPRPSGRLCYVKSPALDAHVLQGAALNTAQSICGVAAETQIASAMSDMQQAASIQYPATSYTTLLLAISGAAVSIVTCEKDQISKGIQRLTKRALKLAAMCVCARCVSSKIMQSAVSLAVYTGVALTIAGPGIAIVVTNIQYSKAVPTSTISVSSGLIVDAPYLEITDSETVKLEYKPENFVVSVIIGCALCALSPRLGHQPRRASSQAASWVAQRTRLAASAGVQHAAQQCAAQSLEHCRGSKRSVHEGEFGVALARSSAAQQQLVLQHAAADDKDDRRRAGLFW